MNKSIYYLSIIFFLAFLTQTEMAQSSYILDSSNSDSVMIKGTSNVHDWECAVQDYSIQAQLNSSALQGSTGGSFLQTFNFSAVAKSIECGKSKMNNKTYDILKADKNSNITFKVNKSSLAPRSSTDNFKLNVTGDLTIAGVTKTVSFPVEGQAMGGKKYHFTGSYTFKTEDYDVERASMLFGTIKTGEDVTILFDIILIAQ